MPKPYPSIVVRERLRYQGYKYLFLGQRLRFPNQTEGDREYIVHPGGAVVVPVTDTGTFVCIRQYRFAVGDYIYEFPAGTLEPGESPEMTIKRELEEEAGLKANRWDNLGQFYLAPGYSDEIMYAYLARDLQPLAEKPPGDEDEDIEVVQFTAAELRHKALHTRELDAKTVTCFYRAMAFLGQL
ncbi:MAG: NUDIX hydrolase [Thermostichales cyanobacterium BF4_bins_65]